MSGYDAEAEAYSALRLMHHVRRSEVNGDILAALWRKAHEAGRKQGAEEMRERAAAVAGPDVVDEGGTAGPGYARGWLNASMTVRAAIDDLPTTPESVAPDDDTKCGCGSPASETPHTCPFAEEINDDADTMCVCCDECEDQCAMDI